MKKLFVGLVLLMALASTTVGLIACGEGDTSATPDSKPAPHSHVYSSEEVAPTCTEQGYTKFTCSCGSTYNENFVLALGHDTISYGAKDATCDQVGYNAYEKCLRCDYSTYIEIAELGHTDIGGYCQVCNQPLSSFRLAYSSINDGTEYEVSLGERYDTDIVIPDEYLGLPVTSIVTEAFYQNTTLISVTIGKNIKYIGNRAFDGCVNLREINFNAIEMEDLNAYNGVFSSAGQSSSSGIQVNIGESVTRIPSYLLNPNGSSNCPYVTSVDFAQTSVCQSIGSSAFANLSGLTQITLPLDARDIGSHSFKGCSNLQKIIIPSGTQEIKAYTFYNCYSLATVLIPESVTAIGYQAFYNCSSISSVLYGGQSSDDWSLITVSSHNASVSNAERYYYSDIQPTLADNGVEYDGNYWRYEEGVPVIWFPSHVIIQATDVNFDDTIFSWVENGCWIKPNSGLEYSATWTLQTDGSLKSTQISALTSTYYEITVTGTGIFNYSYRTSSESNYDKLNVYKNGSSVLTASGRQSSFTSASMSVVVGDVIRFTYSKDGSADSGEDAIYIKIYDGIDSLPTLGDLYGVENSQLPSRLTAVTIEGEGKISNSYFAGCENITTVVVGVGVTAISDNAFAGCTSLTDVYYGGDYGDWLSLTSTYDAIGENNQEFRNANLYYYSETEISSSSTAIYWHYVDGVPTLWP